MKQIICANFDGHNLWNFSLDCFALKLPTTKFFFLVLSNVDWQIGPTLKCPRYWLAMQIVLPFQTLSISLYSILLIYFLFCQPTIDTTSDFQFLCFKVKLVLLLKIWWKCRMGAHSCFLCLSINKIATELLKISHRLFPRQSMRSFPTVRTPDCTSISSLSCQILIDNCLLAVKLWL